MIKRLVEDKHEIYEMSNLRNYATGLPMVIWVQPKSGKEKHGARIKVAKMYGDKTIDDLFTITISDKPEVIGDVGDIKMNDIKKVIKFIKINKDLLLSIWNDEIDPSYAVKYDLFKKI
ncbi:MAG: hypothetical protein ABSG25_01510 [Bryobacteraceae bacterium]